MAWARTGWSSAILKGRRKTKNDAGGQKRPFGAAARVHRISRRHGRVAARGARSGPHRTGCCVLEPAGGYREFIRYCGSKRASSVERTQLPRTSPSAAMMLVTVNALLDPANKLTDKGPAI
jgi:hypothetical protein